jgi:hypothetical protein
MCTWSSSQQIRGNLGCEEAAKKRGITPIEKAAKFVKETKQDIYLC